MTPAVKTATEPIDIGNLALPSSPASARHSRPPMNRQHATALPRASTFASMSRSGMSASIGSPSGHDSRIQVPVETTVKGAEPGAGA